jgi:hypothetical protein
MTLRQNAQQLFVRSGMSVVLFRYALPLILDDQSGRAALRAFPKETGRFRKIAWRGRRNKQRDLLVGAI